MPVKIKFLGHSGILITDGKHNVAVDPFLTGNPVAKQEAKDIKCDTIAISHAHSDHFSDAIEIAKNNNATLVGAYELVQYANSKGVEKIEPANHGGRVKTPFGYIALTQAFHSSSFDGQYMGMPAGIIINIGGINIYHAGDTDIFSDMALIAQNYKPIVSLLPIGDRFTMGPELASRAADLIESKYVIPIHYNTWPPIKQDVSKFKPGASKVVVMQPGEEWTVKP